MPEIKYLHIDNLLLDDVCYLLLSLAHQKDIVHALTRVPLTLPEKPAMTIAVFAVLRKIQLSFGIPHDQMLEVLQEVAAGFNNAETAVEGPKRNG